MENEMKDPSSQQSSYKLYSTLEVQQAIASNDLSQAYEKYTKQLSENPENQVQIYINRAFVLLGLQMTNAATQDSIKAISLDENASPAYFLQGLAALWEKNEDAALTAWKIGLDYTKELAFYTIMNSLINSPNFRAHLYQLRFGIERVINLIDDFVNPHFTVESDLQDAFSELRNNSIEYAIEHFTMIINVNPQNSYAYKGRGVAYCILGEYEKSINDLTLTIQYSPTSQQADVFKVRAFAYSALGNQIQAILDLNKYLLLIPEDDEIKIELAKLHMKRRTYSAAYKLFLSIPENVMNKTNDGLMSFSECLYMMGELENALIVLNKVTNCSTHQYHYQKYLIKRDLNEIEEAKSEILEAVRIVPTFFLLRTVADFLCDLGEVHESIEYYREALQQCPYDAETQLYLSHALFACGNLTESSNLLRELNFEKEKFKFRGSLEHFNEVNFGSDLLKIVESDYNLVETALESTNASIKKLLRGNPTSLKAEQRTLPSNMKPDLNCDPKNPPFSLSELMNSKNQNDLSDLFQDTKSQDPLEKLKEIKNKFAINISGIDFDDDSEEDSMSQQSDAILQGDDLYNQILSASKGLADTQSDIYPNWSTLMNSTNLRQHLDELKNSINQNLDMESKSKEQQQAERFIFDIQDHLADLDLDIDFAHSFDNANDIKENLAELEKSLVRKLDELKNPVVESDIEIDTNIKPPENVDIIIPELELTPEIIQMLKDADRFGSRCSSKVYEKTINKRLTRALGFCILRMAFMMRTQWFETQPKSWLSAFEEIRAILQIADLRKPLYHNRSETSKIGEKSKDRPKRIKLIHFCAPTYYIVKNDCVSARFGFALEKVFQMIRSQIKSKTIDSLEDIYQNIQTDLINGATLENRDGSLLELPLIILKHNGIYGFDLVVSALSDIESWNSYNVQMQESFHNLMKKDEDTTWNLAFFILYIWLRQPLNHYSPEIGLVFLHSFILASTGSEIDAIDESQGENFIKQMIEPNHEEFSHILYQHALENKLDSQYQESSLQFWSTLPSISSMIQLLNAKY